MTRNLLLLEPRIAQRQTSTRRCRTATAVLIAGPLGALRLYSRRAPGVLRCDGPVVTLNQLRRRLRTLPRPRVIILCGRRHLDELAPAVLQDDDLYVVPPHWLADVPGDDLDARAALAARLVSAQRRGAIECLRASLQLPFPF